MNAMGGDGNGKAALPKGYDPRKSREENQQYMPSPPVYRKGGRIHDANFVLPRIQRHLDLHPEPPTIHRSPEATSNGPTDTIFRAKEPRDPTTPREDKRPIPNSVATQGGVEIEVAPGALDHILKGHTVENFDPVARLADVGAGNTTSLFPPGFATNAQEIVTLVKQALGNKAARDFDPSKKRSVELTIRNLKIQVWVGPVGKAKPGAFMLNSAFPVGGVELSAADVKAYADAITKKTKTLQQVRTELLGRFGK